MIITLVSCGEEVYTPKPKGYPRILFPERGYTLYEGSFCPFSFQAPVYAKIVRDTLYFDEKPEHPCWLNVNIPSLNATIHLSYKSVQGNSLAKLLEDMHKMTYKHAIRADYIEDQYISTSNGTFGLLYNVGGNAASSYQFFLTDSSQHFIRGALYINATPNADSLAPVVQFLKQDIDQLINTLEWS